MKMTLAYPVVSASPYMLRSTWGRTGIVKLRLTAVSDPQHGGFTAGSSPVSWGSIDELFVNLTVPTRSRQSREIPSVTCRSAPPISGPAHPVSCPQSTACRYVGEGRPF